jgi:hypothetical protein
VAKEKSVLCPVWMYEMRSENNNKNRASVHALSILVGYFSGSRWRVKGQRRYGPSSAFNHQTSVYRRRLSPSRPPSTYEPVDAST